MNRDLRRGRLGTWPEAWPEWPRSYRRRVYDVRHAIHYPAYVGMFREWAAPAWWRRLVFIRRSWWPCDRRPEAVGRFRIGRRPRFGAWLARSMLLAAAAWVIAGALA